MEGIDKKWMSNKEAIEYLGVGIDFLKKLRHNGEIPYAKVHQTVIYRKKDLDRLVESNWVVKPIG